ncbi:MAG: ABC transporter substrate-binding protein [Sodalis sp. (in: enterobacteria)]|uniref:ABC transporter substrate-binding protein n=1 Tax=Sodalis sp. (in: enterobacteria) TaxID=1898979 RepID=UPI0039E41DD6
MSTTTPHDVMCLSRRSLLATLARTVALAALAVACGVFTLPVISNPALWPLIGGVQNVMVNRVLFNNLTTYGDPGQKVVGDLAESWTVAEDGLNWTFNLRKNVKWHDGTAFTADDVIFAINKVWLNSEISFPQRSNFTMLVRAEKLDDYSVKLVTTDPTPALPVLLGYLAPILPVHSLGDWTPEQFTQPAAFSKRPIGTGPFQFAEFVPGSYVRLARFDDFFGGKPQLDAVAFKVMPDLEQQFAQLQSGQLDWMLIEPYQMDAIKANSKLRVNEVLSNTYFFVSLNNQVFPFNDKQVRQALAYATDRRSIIDSSLYGMAEPAASPITPVLAKYHNSSVKRYDFDLARAAQILDDAGWKVGARGIRSKDGKPLKFLLEVDVGNMTRQQIALILQDTWKKLGVDVTLKAGDFGALVQRLRAKPSDVQEAITWYITAPNPDIITYYGTNRSLNIAKYSNPQTDALLEKGRLTVDEGERINIYQRVQEIIADDAPVIFLYYAHDIECLSSAIHGWSPTLGYRYSLGELADVRRDR